MHTIPISATTAQCLNEKLSHEFKDRTELTLSELTNLLKLIGTETSLINALLADVLISMDSIAEEKEGTPEHNKFLFLLACMAGLIYAIADGIDGIVSILQLLHLANPFFTLVASFFTLLAVIVFIGFDIVEAASNFGFTLKDHNHHLDDIKKEKDLIHELSLAVEKKSVQTTSPEDLKAMANFLNELRACNDFSDEQINTLLALQKAHYYLYLAQNVAAALCCVLFLSFGFFTGQAAALYLLGDMTMKIAMSQTFSAALTLLGGGISAVGCAAFYWMVERPGVEKLISKLLCGIDTEVLDELSCAQTQTKLSQSLKAKSENMGRTAELCLENAHLKKTLAAEQGSQEMPRGSSANRSVFFQPIPLKGASVSTSSSPLNGFSNRG